MPRMKVSRSIIDEDVIYDDVHWATLNSKRNLALEIMTPLADLTPNVIVYGSIARGDVRPSSDIDILVMDDLPSYMILNVLQTLGKMIIEQSIVMATPNNAIKGHIKMEQDITVSFPMVPLKEREMDFYSFGGYVTAEQLGQNICVRGIDKRLVLVEPNAKGHHARSIMHIPESELMKLGFKQRLIEERLRVLERRDKVGRTGVFLHEIIDPEVGFEFSLKQIMDRNQLVRRKVNRDG